jgi:hypothetical protein
MTEHPVKKRKASYSIAPGPSGLTSYATLLAILLIAAVSILIAWQGWRSRGLNFDMVNFIEGAHELLSVGTLPDRGDVSSYGSFSVPGAAWLLLPGMVFFNDPRLFEFVSAACLHLGTLLGLFFLTRLYFGTACAFLAVVLYAFSRIGLFYAGTIYPIGHPFFYVWIAYFAILWVTRGDTRFAAMAVALWLAGMYVDMAIAPVIFVLPALWLFYRPPIQTWPLVAAGIIGLLIWYPYIRFQLTRGFVDVRSQLLLQKVVPPNYKDAWCDPTLVLKDARATQDPTTATAIDSSAFKAKIWDHWLIRALWYRWNSTLDHMISNFAINATVANVSAIMLLLVLYTFLILGFGYSLRERASTSHFGKLGGRWPARVGIAMILLAVLLNEFLIESLKPDGLLELTTRSYIRRLQLALLVIGLALLASRQVVAILKRTSVSAGHDPRRDRSLLIVLVIPWSILVTVAESGRPERFLWLWPLQVILLAASLSYIRHPLPSRLAQVLLLAIIIANPLLLSRAESWLISGWSGNDAESIQAINYIADELQFRGQNRSTIGYETFTYGFAAKYHHIEPRYKVGAHFDLVFKFGYGISNTNRCAEGVSSRDEYRIIQTRPKQSGKPGDFFDGTGLEYFEIPSDGSFRSVAEFGNYQVLRRIDALKR